MPKNVFAGVGISKNDDPFVAGKEAVEKAINEMKKRGGKKPTFGIVFCSGGKYGKDDKTLQKFVNGTHSVFGNTPWMGCTTCGEISNYGATENSCVACVISSDYLQIGIGIGDEVHKDPMKAGRTAAQQAVTNLRREKIVTPYLRYIAEKRKSSAELMRMYSYFVLLFSPGLVMDINGMEDGVLEGVCEVIGRQTPIIGGTAGDDAGLIKNYEFANGKVYKDAAIAVVIYTGLRSGFDFGHGYTLTDEKCVVTKSKDYVVHELDGRPALEIYAKMLKMKVEELWTTKEAIMMKMTPFAKMAAKFFSAKMNPKAIPFLSIVTTNPLGIIDIHGNIAIRLPLRVVGGKNLLFVEKVPENMVLNKLEINPKKVVEAEENAIIGAKNDANDDPEILFVFDCSLRKIFSLGEEKLEKIIETIKKKYPDTKIIGFGSMGEFTFNRKSGPMTNSTAVSVGVITDKLVTD